MRERVTNVEQVGDGFEFGESERLERSSRTTQEVLFRHPTRESEPREGGGQSRTS